VRFRRRFVIGAASLVAIGLVGIAALEFKTVPNAGEPLPSYTLAELAEARPANLPEYIRLAGSVPHPDWSWTHSFKQITFYDLPRTSSNWQTGQPVILVEWDELSKGIPRNPPGDVEGQLSLINTLPGWGSQGDESLWSATMPVYVLRRLPLGGKVPGAPTHNSAFILNMALPLAALILLLSIVCTRPRSNNFRQAGHR